MPSSKPTPTHELHEKEHDEDSPQAKRVLMYGWDSDALTKRRLSVDSEGNAHINSSEANYALQLDEAASSITYVGKAAIGTATSAASWQIMRLDESGDPELVITWADSNDSFDNVWDNRAALSYG